MKRCPKCKKVFTDKESVCKECKNKALIEMTDIHTPVWLCNCNASQREIIVNALKENSIPSSYESQSQPSGMAMEGYDILVPYGAYKDALQVAQQTGFVDIDEELFNNIDDFPDSNEFDDMETMTPAKRTTVRVLSAIAIIILFSVVIIGVDYIMELIKGLFY